MQMNLDENLQFYSDSIKGPITIIRVFPKHNEVLVSYIENAITKRESWKLSEIIHGFQNKLYRLNAIPGMQAVINDPGELIVVRMALPGFRERIQSNINLITIGTPEGTILLEAYNNYLKTTDILIKRLNA